MPPTTMMPLMALVTLISGVCRAGVTFQITCQPTMQARANTVRCERNADGATRPRAISAPAPTTAATEAPTLPRARGAGLAAAGVAGAASCDGGGGSLGRFGGAEGGRGLLGGG